MATVDISKQVFGYLQEFGLNDKEINIYLTLLKTGPSTIMDLARKTAIKRSTTHNNVEELIKKGLVSQTNYGERRMVIAEDPEKLKFLLEQRKWDVQKLEKNMTDIVGEIYNLVPKARENSRMEVKYYEGSKGVKLIYEEALRAKELRSFVNIEKVIQHLPDNGDLFLEAQKKNKNLKLWEIVEDSAISREFSKQFSKSPNYFYKFSPTDLTVTAVDILIFDDKVGIITLGQDMSVSGTVISNPNYYNNMKAVFDFVWNTIPESKSIK
jgi:sugar-specific transcriptional regulator TrmB